MLDRTTRSEYQLNLIEKTAEAGKTQTRPIELWKSEVKKWRRKGFKVTAANSEAGKRLQEKHKALCIISWNEPGENLAQLFYKISCENKD